MAVKQLTLRASQNQPQLKPNPTWYVYIAECNNKTLYTGITTDLSRREKTHKQGKGGYYTRSFGVSRILHTEEHPTRSAAQQREYQIKGWSRKKKFALINNDMEGLKKRP
ncbi:MAG: GIY-YIG nuclease family protein [bacterium]